MGGRADIEGSKSDVAMSAWPPQASYPCGNFSDTSSLEARNREQSEGSKATLSRFAFALKIEIKRAFALLLCVRFLSSLSSSWDTCVTV